jgi:DNA-binding NarL/FixJ family response regulator
VFKLLALELSNKGIGCQLAASEGMVKLHIRTLRKKNNHT